MSLVNEGMLVFMEMRVLHPVEAYQLVALPPHLPPWSYHLIYWVTHHQNWYFFFPHSLHPPLKPVYLWNLFCLWNSVICEHFHDKTLKLVFEPIDDSVNYTLILSSVTFEISFLDLAVSKTCPKPRRLLLISGYELDSHQWGGEAAAAAVPVPLEGLMNN